MANHDATFPADSLSTWAPRLLSVLRITAAFTFLQHGSAKLLGFPKVEMFANLQLASIYGARRRPRAGRRHPAADRPVHAAGGLHPGRQMAVAYFMAHSSPFFSPMLSGGEAAYLFCFVFLYIWAAGPGPWSVDAARRKA